MDISEAFHFQEAVSWVSNLYLGIISCSPILGWRRKNSQRVYRYRVMTGKGYYASFSLPIEGKAVDGLCSIGGDE